MEMHLKVLPKVTEVQVEVGGSWCSLKRILANLKDRMFGNPRSRKQISRETTHSTVDSAASEVIATQTGDGENIAESEGSNNMRGSTDKIKHNECETTVRVVGAIISDKPNEVKLENGKRLIGESTFGTFR
ncbi:hypothetical protein Peur_042100 [Populus x canadensis]